MKKKLLTITLILTLGLVTLAGCGTKEIVKSPSKETSGTIDKIDKNKNDLPGKGNKSDKTDDAEKNKPSGEVKDPTVEEPTGGVENPETGGDPFEEMGAQVEEVLANMIDAIYESIENIELPGCFTAPIVEEYDMEYNLGTTELPGLEAGAVSNPMMSSIAHSICVLRFDTNENAVAAANTLLKTAPVAKWVCVSAEKIGTSVVDEVYVIFVMSTSEIVDALNLDNVAEAGVGSGASGVGDGFVIPVPTN